MEEEIEFEGKFDSKEEEHFSWWMMELVDQGYASRWERAPSYELVPSITQPYLEKRTSKRTGKPMPDLQKQKTLKTRLKYTPDFKIIWTLKGMGLFYVEHEAPPFMDGPVTHHLIANRDEDGKVFSLIEVKPSLAGQNRMNSSRMSVARMNAMFLYYRHGIFTNLIEVGTNDKSIFNKTFLPLRYRLTDKTLKPRKINFQHRRIDQFAAGTTKLKTVIKTTKK